MDFSFKKQMTKAIRNAFGDCLISHSAFDLVEALQNGEQVFRVRKVFNGEDADLLIGDEDEVIQAFCDHHEITEDEVETYEVHVDLLRELGYL